MALHINNFIVGKQEVPVKKQEPVFAGPFGQIRKSLIPSVFSNGGLVPKMQVGSFIVKDPVYSEPAIVAPGAYDYVEEQTNMIAAPEVVVLIHSTKPVIQKPKTSDYLRDLTIHK